MSNFTAGTVKVEANMSETATVIAQFVLQMYNKKLFDLENEWQSDRAQHPELCHSITNIEIY